MKTSLKTVLNRVEKLENTSNSKILLEYYKAKVEDENTENTLMNTLKRLLNFCEYNPTLNISEIKKDEDVINFLQTKVKNNENNEGWKSTYNGYVIIIKQFYRWLYNRKKNDKSSWVTPKFVKSISQKKLRGEGKYSEINIWSRDEVIDIIKYEPNIRNKTIIAMLWDFNSRPHEVTSLRVGDIIFRDSYAEGKISAFTKTGKRDILLRLAFPYARDYINSHPHKNDSDAPFITNLKNGKRLDAGMIYFILKKLKDRIKRDLDNNIISDREEREKLVYLLKTKKWNPYCFRHSSITDDSNFLTDSALVKKVGWSMNTRQRNRYIKTNFNDELKNQILNRDGIEVNKKKITLSNLTCSKCQYVNRIDAQLCSECGYIISQEYLNKIKEEEEKERIDIKKQLRELKTQINVQTFNTVLTEYTDRKARELKKEGVYIIKPQVQLELFKRVRPNTSKEDLELLEEYVKSGQCADIKIINDKEDKIIVRKANEFEYK